METLEPQTIVKGGATWFNIAIERGPKGLEIFAKTDPRVENFIKSLGAGKKDDVTLYGRSWHSLSGKPLEIHQIESQQKGQLGQVGYTLDAPAEGFQSQRDGCINLSFLRIVGIGDAEGIRFGISGPHSKTHVRELMTAVVRETRNLIRDYIVPIHVNLRITSTEI